MSSILEELRERVQQTGSALEEAKKSAAKALAKQATLEADLQAYASALQAEERATEFLWLSKKFLLSTGDGRTWRLSQIPTSLPLISQMKFAAF